VGYKKAVIGYSKEQLQGEVYQCLFQSEAYKRGLLVEKSDVPLPWDFTVTNPEKVKSPLRVQVKGTGTLIQESGKGRYKITVKTGYAKAGPIDSDIIDVCSFYVENTQTWYNIPITAIKGKAIWLYPHIKRSKGQYEAWKYDWSVFFA